MSQTKTAVISLLIASALALPALGQAQTPAPAASGSAAMTLNKADQKAVVDMAMANMAEVAAGKMAVAKSQNPQVKAYAQKMVDDHTTAQADVATLAQSKGVTLPTDVDAPHKAMAARLDKLSGDAFDKAYMKEAGVADHTKVHAKLAAAASKARDPDVKAAAAKMMPVVEQHLQQAKALPGANGGAAK